MNPVLEVFRQHTQRYQERTTAFRRPEQVLEALAANPEGRLDLTPYEFQCTVAHMLITKTGTDVSTRPEKLVQALQQLLNQEAK